MEDIASVLAKKGFLNFKLREGYSAETSGMLITLFLIFIYMYVYICTFISGGLMVCLPKDKADAFCKEIEVC